MTERFLRYSVENGRKISVVLMHEGKILRKNLQVLSIDWERECAHVRFPGKKKESILPFSDLLTADYARGDHGELE